MALWQTVLYQFMPVFAARPRDVSNSGHLFHISLIPFENCGFVISTCYDHLELLIWQQLQQMKLAMIRHMMHRMAIAGSRVGKKQTMNLPCRKRFRQQCQTLSTIRSIIGLHQGPPIDDEHKDLDHRIFCGAALG